MDYYDEQDHEWDKLRDDPKWQSERDKFRGMLDYQLSYKSLEKGVQELLEAHTDTEGATMANSTYKYTPNAEQMRYDLVDHHLHMLALFELLSIARSNLNNDYRFKSDDEIKSEWLLTFDSEE